MKIKNIVDEDFINYKFPSMFIGCHSCCFKCDLLAGKQVCQNSTLANSPDIDISVDDLIHRYLQNDLTNAIIFSGLEPFEDVVNVIDFAVKLRNAGCEDDIVIFTGYTEQEVNELFDREISILKELKNVIIKFGRFIPDEPEHYDPILGVNLHSDNQYAKKIS